MQLYLELQQLQLLQDIVQLVSPSANMQNVGHASMIPFYITQGRDAAAVTFRLDTSACAASHTETGYSTHLFSTGLSASSIDDKRVKLLLQFVEPELSLAKAPPSRWCMQATAPCCSMNGLHNISVPRDVSCTAKSHCLSRLGGPYVQWDRLQLPLATLTIIAANKMIVVESLA